MSGPRFGVWAPVYGNHGARDHPDDAPDASYRRTRDLIVVAEAAGFDSPWWPSTSCTPVPSRTTLETWSTLAGLAEATSRIELIGAIKPLLFNPLVFAKLAGNIAEISDGRLSINVVSGWFLPNWKRWHRGARARRPLRPHPAVAGDRDRAVGGKAGDHRWR
jgi:alkanesulfonate monooxygenase